MKKVEFNTRFQPADDTLLLCDKLVMFTPSVGKAYWLFRVKLFKDQAILGFPKFNTIGIGFAIEETDSNTNLPYSLYPEQIYSHIKANKKYDEISKEECIQAIKLVIKHSKDFMSNGNSKPSRKIKRVVC